LQEEHAGQWLERPGGEAGLVKLVARSRKLGVYRAIAYAGHPLAPIWRGLPPDLDDAMRRGVVFDNGSMLSV
jgi:hypothetical protein